MADNANGAWTDYVWLNRRLIGRIRGGTVHAIHGDQVGRPQVVTDANGAVVWLAANYPFEREVALDSIGGLNLGFPGQYYDADRGTWNNGFRDYSAQLGRYVESDPIGLGGGINTYAYVGGSPLMYTDPYGLASPAMKLALERAGVIDAMGGGPEDPVGDLVAIGVFSGTLIVAAYEARNIQQSTGLPDGYWPADKGASEWGRRQGVGAREGKGRFHGIKQSCPGSKPTDVFGVNPDTGDVVDPEGEVVGNLEDVKSK
jgi:RHS repeat-associated protein